MLRHNYLIQTGPLSENRETRRLLVFRIVLPESCSIGQDGPIHETARVRVVG